MATFWLILSSLLCAVTESRVILTPFPVVSVCPNRHITLSCMTNLSFMEWNITVFQSGMSFSRRHLVSSTSRFDLPLIVNMIAFSITRISPDESHPLVTLISVANATPTLNQTKIRCKELGMTASTTSSMVTTVNVIMPESIYPKSPELEGALTIKTSNTVTVFLSWIPENMVDYDVTIVPDTYLTFNDSTSIQMMLSYNTKYNVTVTATSCGQNSAQTHKILNFVKCTYPLNSGPSMIGESVRVSIDKNIALEGVIITYTCPSGLTLVGDNTSVCLSNGQWQPDPRKVECRDEVPQHRTGVVITIVSSSVGVLILSSIVVFSIGLLCRWQTYKKCKSSNISQPQPSAMYDDVPPPNTSNKKRRSLRLKKNLAYETSSKTKAMNTQYENTSI